MGVGGRRSIGKEIDSRLHKRSSDFEAVLKDEALPDVETVTFARSSTAINQIDIVFNAEEFDDLKNQFALYQTSQPADGFNNFNFSTPELWDDIWFGENSTYIAKSEEFHILAGSGEDLLAVATDEQHAIAQDTASLVAERDKVGGARPIPVAISARHIHLTRDAVAVLFGEGHELTPIKELSQPKQFACEEKLDVVGPKRTIEGVRVLGPPRGKVQVEISRTDEFFLGLDAPVRDSGDVGGSASCTLVGPKGKLEIPEGVICARRHIHMTPDDADYYGVEDKDVVEVRIDSEGRDLVFGDVLIRVSKNYALEMHIDTDEANAAELSRGAEGLLMATEGTAHLRKRSTKAPTKRA